MSNDKKLMKAMHRYYVADREGSRSASWVDKETKQHLSFFLETRSKAVNDFNQELIDLITLKKLT